MAKKMWVGGIVVLLGLCIGVRAQVRTGPPSLDRQLKTARTFEAGRRHEEALRVYREAYKAAPDHREVVQGLDRTLSKLGRFDEVAHLLKKAIQRAPEYGYFRMRLGEVLYDLGQPEEAANWWDSIIETGPDHRPNYTLVAREYSWRGEELKARAIYLKARAHFGEKGLFAKEIGKLSAIEENYVGAASEYLLYLEEQPNRYDLIRELLSNFPRDRETAQGVTDVLKAAVLQAPKDATRQKLLVEYLLITERPQQALHQIRRMASSDVGGQHLEPTLLQWADRISDPKVGAQAYLEAIERFPKSRQRPRMLLGLAQAQEASGNYAGALASYEKLAKEAPDARTRSEARYRMARIEQKKLGNADAALALFRELAKDLDRALYGRARPEPFVIESAFGMAQCLLIKGDPDQALKILDRMSGQRAPTKVREEALYRGAEIAFLRGDFEEAVALSETLIQTFPEGLFVNDALKLAVFVEENGEPEEALTLFAQARLRRRQRKFGEASTLLNRIAKTFPTAQVRDDAFFLSSTLSMDKGDYAEAIARCRALIERIPDSPLSPEARQRIGRIYDEFQNKPEQALSEYERVLTDYPESLLDADVRSRIRRLREKTEKINEK
jgi:tetratricopeptide (TPR) repeat protein